MLVQDLISKLTELAQSHGNLPVMDEYGKIVDEPEFNDDDGKCILLTFDES